MNTLGGGWWSSQKPPADVSTAAAGMSVGLPEAELNICGMLAHAVLCSHPPRTEMRTAQDMILTPSLPAGRSSIIGRIIGCSSTVLQCTMLAIDRNNLLNSMQQSCMHRSGQHVESSLVHVRLYASPTTAL